MLFYLATANLDRQEENNLSPIKAPKGYRDEEEVVCLENSPENNGKDKSLYTFF